MPSAEKVLTEDQANITSLSYVGIFLVISLSSIGASIGTCLSSNGFFHLAVSKPQKMSKYLTQVLMSGVVGLYGLLGAILIIMNSRTDVVSKMNGMHNGYSKLCAGGLLGVACLSSGWALGVIGEGSLKAMSRRA